MRTHFRTHAEINTLIGDTVLCTIKWTIYTIITCWLFTGLGTSIIKCLLG